MLKGTANILDWLRTNETENFRIKSSEKGDTILQFRDNESATNEDAIHTLQRMIEMLEPGSYYIETWGHNSNQKDWKKTRFILGSGSQISGLNIPMVPAIGKEEIQEQIAKGIRDYQLQRDNEELKRENQELKAKYDNVIFRILERAEPYVGTILKGLFPGQGLNLQPSAISGIKENQTMEDQKLTQRAEKALEKWYDLDNDAVLLMEKIGHLAQSNPAMYKQAKSILMNS